MFLLIVLEQGKCGSGGGAGGGLGWDGVAGCRLFCSRLVRALGSWQLGEEPQLSLVTLCEASSELTIAAVLQI